VQAHVARTAARLRADSERVSAEQRLRHVGITTVACSETETVHATHVEPVAVSPPRSGVG
jgi:hypothetical protein